MYVYFKPNIIRVVVIVVQVSDAVLESFVNDFEHLNKVYVPYLF